MSVMIYDTLKLPKDLQKAFTPEQSEVLAEALTQNAGDNLATKSDSAALKTDIAVVKTEIANL